MILAPKIGEHAPSLSLLRPDGTEVALDDLLGGRATVLLFVRHYG